MNKKKRMDGWREKRHDEWVEATSNCYPASVFIWRKASGSSLLFLVCAAGTVSCVTASVSKWLTDC